MRLLGNLTDPFILSWNISSMATFLLPLFIFMVARLTNQEEWNNENNNQEQQNNNNNNDNPYANPDNYDEYGNYVGPTHWWKFWRRSNRNYGGEQGDDENRNSLRTPWWYIWGEDQAEREPDDEGNGTVLLVYVWMLVVFAAIVYFGNTTEMLPNKLEGLRWGLVGFANFCLVIMVLLIGLEAIEIDARELEGDGFYGQTAVLLLMTCFFSLIHALVFIVWGGKRFKAQEASPEKLEKIVDVDYALSPAIESPEKLERIGDVNYARSPSIGYMGFQV